MPDTAPDRTAPGGDPERTIEKLKLINAALMSRVERSLGQQQNAFSLFQTAVALDSEIRSRTSELNATLEKLAKANHDLTAARDEAERANRSKTGFFTAVSHDLLQPLQAARLTLSTLSAIQTEPQGDRLARQTEEALAAVDDLLRTILDLSKLDSGALRPALQPVALHEVFETVRRALQPSADGKAIGLTVKPTDLVVRSDPMMLRRIVQNLLANAVHYTDRGGVLLAARRRGAGVRLDVWDTGHGIAPLERERIFDEFERGSASRLTGAGGLGLGLSIVRRMADALGHPLAVRSIPGRGSCFTLTMAEGLRPEPAGNDTAPPGEPKRLAAIIVGRDDGGAAEVADLLRRWGWQIGTAASLGSIRTSLGGGRPDLIVVGGRRDDAGFGLAAVAEARAAWGESLPAIALAGAAASLGALGTVPAVERLRHPVKPAELRALVMFLVAS